MNRKGPIMVAVALLLGAGAIPGVSVRAAAAADFSTRVCQAAGGQYSHGTCQSTTDRAAAWKAECEARGGTYFSAEYCEVPAGGLRPR
jgi:hypothetical protein